MIYSVALSFMLLEAASKGSVVYHSDAGTLVEYALVPILGVVNLALTLYRNWLEK